MKANELCPSPNLQALDIGTDNEVWFDSLAMILDQVEVDRYLGRQTSSSGDWELIN